MFGANPKNPASRALLSNAEIAARLLSLAQLLAAQKENPFKIKAYRRAARTIRALSESMDELVRSEADLTAYAGIGPGISAAIREIVQSGTLGKLEKLRAEIPPEIVAITAYPLLDPKRVQRIYKKLNISSIDELREKLEAGLIAERLGARMDYHVRQALIEQHEMLLYHAEPLGAAIERFLRSKGKVSRAAVTGAVRRKVEVVTQISVLVETDDFPAAVHHVERYGGRTELVEMQHDTALFHLPAGIPLRLDIATKQWGLAKVLATGSAEHLRKLSAAGLGALTSSGRELAEEVDLYQALNLQFVPPELREGQNEIELASRNQLPELVTLEDIRGDLHAHSTSSDGSNSIEEMASAAQHKGYEYLGITDHSQSLKIARGLLPETLWQQIRAIDKLNEKLDGFTVLKSAEVDILPDGSLDYPDDLLRELDYTVCSIHSKFQLGRKEQTERVLRAMDNRYFGILGHATGRLLLKRTGYELDFAKVVRHARENGCFFEINSSPDRLDVSAENARLASEAGVKIAISTDAHSTRELDLITWGLNQARRAGLDRHKVLNCLSLAEFRRAIRR
jgi:DNA polymerase (family 10)